VTGGYDHLVKLWDMRAIRAADAGAGAGASDTAGTTVSNAASSAMSFDHGAPVEDVLVLPAGNAVVTAGSNNVKVWDLIGGKLLRTLSNHQKTVTSLCLDGTGTRLLSASLDHFVKVYSLDTFDVMHGTKHSSPILSVACAVRVVAAWCAHLASIWLTASRFGSRTILAS